jgi:hypothetical protein
VRGGRHRPAPGGLDTEEVVMAETKRRLSEDERAERRARDRERLQHAAEQLLTSDGWQRWVRARALFHNYSLHNCLLLAAQCHERGIEATRVAGFSDVAEARPLRTQGREGPRRAGADPDQARRQRARRGGG